MRCSVWRGGSPDCAKSLGESGVCGTCGATRYMSVALGRNKVFNMQYLSEMCAGCRESSVGSWMITANRVMLACR